MVRTATPLLLAGLGGLVTERAGVINIGLEGSIIAGVLDATVAAGGFAACGGYVGGMLAGGVLGPLLALFIVLIRADQIITGTAITLLALGWTGTFYRALYGATGVALSLPTSSAVCIPGFASLL